MNILASPAADPVPAGIAGTAVLIRDKNWAATPLGPRDAWPAALAALVEVTQGSSQPMFVVWGPEQTLVYNDAYAQVLGGKHPAALGCPFLEVWAEIRDDLAPIVAAAYAGQPVHMDDITLVMHRHGFPEETHFAFSYTPVRDADGAVAGFFCACVETTAQVMAERERRRMEAESRDVLEGMGEGFILLGPDFRIRRINAEGLRIDGRPAEAILGRHLLEVWPEAEFMPPWPMYQRAMAAREAAQVVYRHTSEVHDVWLEVRAYPSGDGLAVFYRDVSDTRRAQEALRESEDHYRHAVELDPQTTWTSAPDGQLDHVNSRWMEWTGTTGLGSTWADGLHADDRARTFEVWAHSVTTGAPYDIEHRVKMRDGSYRWMHSRAYPRHDEDGQIVKWYGTTEDVHERRLAESRLRDSEAKFQAIANSIDQMIWSTRPDGFHDYYNDRWYDYTGVPQGSTDGEAWNGMFHPDDRAHAWKLWRHSLETGEPYYVEYRLRHRTGHYRWVIGRAQCVRDRKGRITRWFGTCTDVHDLKTAQAELLHANALLSAVMEAMPGVVYAKDGDGRMLAANRGTAELVGKPLRDIIGRTDAEFLDDPAQAAAIAQNDRRVMDENRTEILEELVSAPDGTLRVWLSTKAPFRDPTGTVVGLVGASVDITERKRTEDRLRELNETLEGQVAASTAERNRIWQMSRDLFAIMGFDGRLKAINPAWEHTLGFDRATLLDRDFAQQVHPDDHASVRGVMEQLLAGDVVVGFEDRLRHSDGSWRWISWTLVPSGDVFYAVGRDITAEKDRTAELQQAQEALRQAQKMEAVGQLTGGIAHDFNNLLTGIIGSLDMMQRRIAAGRTGEIDRFVSAAVTSANRAAALTHRLLAFSRRQPLDPKPVDANRLVTSMEELLRRTIGESFALEIVTAGGLWQTLCDSHQLESALLNLAINGRDAMPNGGKLTIETCNAHLDSAYVAQSRDVRPGQYVCICVSDTGTGMSKDTQAKAFDPFFTTKPIGQGTGLGLSMVYGFARQSDGYAKIYSEEGQGTTVKLYLPRFYGEGEKSEESARAADAPGRAEHGEVVLVVEDETAVRNLVVEVLADLGYRALEAADGPSGLKVLEGASRIDLLITDVGLPGLNGRQLADAARTRRPGLKVLFMTGYAENAAINSGFLEPGMELITKPFAIDSLASRIRASIEKG